MEILNTIINTDNFEFIVSILTFEYTNIISLNNDNNILISDISRKIFSSSGEIIYRFDEVIEYSVDVNVNKSTKNITFNEYGQSAWWYWNALTLWDLRKKGLID